MINKIRKCVYCRNNKATTRDHVPPKCLFPKPRPNDLITVPACESCNKAASQDEEYFLSVIMLTDAGVTETGRSHWKKLRRMYNRRRGVKSTIASSIENKPYFTPTGIYLGHRLTISHDDSRFRNVVLKIVRGLYFFEYDEIFPEKATIQYRFLISRHERNNMLKYLSETKKPKRIWPGTFEYRQNRTANRPEGSIWLFLFFGVAHFCVVTT